MMTVRVYRDGTGYEKTYTNVYDIEDRDGRFTLYLSAETFEDAEEETYNRWYGWDYEIDERVQYAE